MNNLGTLYNDGRGVSRNTKLAKEWFDKAAPLGVSEAEQRGCEDAYLFCVYLSAQPSTTASVANIIVTAIATRIVSRVIVVLHH